MSDKVHIVVPSQPGFSAWIERDEKFGGKWVGRDSGGRWAVSQSLAYIKKAAAKRFGEAVFSDSPLCASCFEVAHGSEPDMGEDGFTFAPGVCGRCGQSMIVWSEVTW